MQKHTIKCLLIDDDADDQEFFKLAVANLNIGVQLSAVSSGEEAFEALDARNLPDCIFLDLNMPKMNGREFLKKIKNTNGLNEIPVLIYSTSTSARDKTDMLLLGARQFITKPNSVSDLIAVLKAELDKIKAGI